MELKLKQRIIGGTVLGVIVLIVIAILSLKGRTPGEAGLAAGIPAPQPLKLDLANKTQVQTEKTVSAVASAPANMMVTPPAQTEASAANSVAVPTAPVKVENPPSSEPIKNSGNNLTQAAVAKQAPKLPAAKAVANEANIIDKPAKLKNHNVAKADNHKKLPAAKMAEAWAIRLGVFAKQGNADKLVKELRQKGFRAYLQKEKSSHGIFYRVFVGPELKQAKANQMVDKIQKSMHIKGQVVKYKL